MVGSDKPPVDSTTCVAHQWVAGMVFVDAEDVAMVAEMRAVNGASLVTCYRCGINYTPELHTRR